MNEPLPTFPEVFDLDPDLLSDETVLALATGIRQWCPSAAGLTNWAWTPERLARRRRLLARLEALEANQEEAQARTLAALRRQAREHLAQLAKQSGVPAGFQDELTKQILDSYCPDHVLLRHDALEALCEEVYDLYAESVLSGLRSEQRLRDAASRLGLTYEVVHDEPQEREDAPAYPVVRVCDRQGRCIRVELFIGGFSMGNSISRILDPRPEAWTAADYDAASWLALKWYLHAGPPDAEEQGGADALG